MRGVLHHCHAQNGLKWWVFTAPVAVLFAGSEASLAGLSLVSKWHIFWHVCLSNFSPTFKKKKTKTKQRVLHKNDTFGTFCKHLKFYKRVFLPSEQCLSHKTLWDEGIHLWLLKTCLNRCCQAGNTRRGKESSSGSLCTSKTAPCLSAWFGIELLSPAFPWQKKRQFSMLNKGHSYYDFPCLSQDIRAVFSWLSLITNPIPILKKLSWLGKEREKNWFIFLPTLLLPPLPDACCSAALGYEYFAGIFWLSRSAWRREVSHCHSNSYRL